MWLNTHLSSKIQPKYRFFLKDFNYYERIMSVYVCVRAQTHRLQVWLCSLACKGLIASFVSRIPQHKLREKIQSFFFFKSRCVPCLPHFFVESRSLILEKSIYILCTTACLWSCLPTQTKAPVLQYLKIVLPRHGHPSVTRGLFTSRVCKRSVQLRPNKFRAQRCELSISVSCK